MSDAVLLHDVEHRRFVPQINVLKHIAGMTAHGSKLARCGVGQAVQVDEPLDVRLINECWTTFEPMNPAPRSQKLHGKRRRC